MIPRCGKPAKSGPCGRVAAHDGPCLHRAPPPTAAALVMALCCGLVAGAEVKVAPEVKAKPGRLLKISAVSDDKAVIRWLNVHESLDVIESETGRYAVVLATAPGRYKLGLYSDAGGPPAYCVVVVEGDAPKPPDPRPPDPKPDDPLAVALRAAYATDKAPDRPKAKAALAAAWRAGAAATADAAVATWGDILGAVRSAAASLAGPIETVLPATRKAIAGHLAATLPTDPRRPFLSADRERARAAFLAIAAALEAIP